MIEEYASFFGAAAGVWAVLWGAYIVAYSERLSRETLAWKRKWNITSTELDRAELVFRCGVTAVAVGVIMLAWSAVGPTFP